MRQRWKQTPRPDRGRGVTAAQRAFNSHGGGSNPSGLIASCQQLDREGLFELTADGR